MIRDKAYNEQIERCKACLCKTGVLRIAIEPNNIVNDIPCDEKRGKRIYCTGIKNKG